RIQLRLCASTSVGCASPAGDDTAPGAVRYRVAHTAGSATTSAIIATSGTSSAPYDDSAQPPSAAPSAIPAFAADAPSVAARSRPSPAREITRSWRGGVTPKPTSPQTASSTPARTALVPKTHSAPGVATRTTLPTSSVFEGSRPANRPPPNVPLEPSADERRVRNERRAGRQPG